VASAQSSGPIGVARVQKRRLFVAASRRSAGSGRIYIGIIDSKP
tara:strand:+ start:281 stop:412 length:132 start_codon:yes stop_codon:yes gene_type:complete